MTPHGELERQVEQRASGRCEYCLMHQSLQGATFHVEHVIPRSLGGASSLENLAWACPSCNLHKSNRVEVRPAEGVELIPLFNPRTDEWTVHFRWNAYEILGNSPVGWVTVETLRFNDERRIRIRQAEELFGLFPPGGRD